MKYEYTHIWLLLNEQIKNSKKRCQWVCGKESDEQSSLFFIERITLTYY